MLGLTAQVECMEQEEERKSVDFENMMVRIRDCRHLLRLATIVRVHVLLYFFGTFVGPIDIRNHG